MFRKMAGILLAAVCVLALMTASGAGWVGFPNPVRNVTAEEMKEKTGVVFPLPEEAEEVAYSIVTMGDEGDISQVRFTMYGSEYCCRMQPAVGRRDISGMYYEWEKDESVYMANAQAALFYNEMDVGIALWYSGYKGLTCSVSMDTGATPYALGEAAKLIDASQGPREHNADIPGDYDVQEESTLTVRLRANPTTGYRWTYEISREDTLGVDMEDFIPDKDEEGRIKDEGMYVATFSPTLGDGGWVSLTFRYLREWEGKEPQQTYVFRLWINETGMLSVEQID